jgi:hypothetical protein
LLVVIFPLKQQVEVAVRVLRQQMLRHKRQVQVVLVFLVLFLVLQLIIQVAAVGEQITELVLRVGLAVVVQAVTPLLDRPVLQTQAAEVEAAVAAVELFQAVRAVLAL